MPKLAPAPERLLVATCLVATVDTTAGAALAQLPTVERVVQVGCDDCTGPTQFSTIFDVAVTDAGDIVVADRSAPMIRAFDRVGKPRWSTGRAGSGPGEYLFPARIGVGTDGGVTVLDMRQRRHTRLAKDGALIGSSSFTGFLAASAARRGTGEVVLLIDDFTGPHAIQRWPAGTRNPIPHASLPRHASTRGGFVQPSIAVAPTGILAFTIDPFVYRIGRLGADGRPMPDLVRDIPPLRRTEAEIEELSARVASGRARRAAEGRSPAVGGGSARAGVDLSVKPHIILDGLRFDDTGRLWVLTMRGAGQTSVFDIFAASGAFLGSLTLPVRVSTFSLGGPYLVTAGEDADDIPRVTLWRVQG